MDRLDRKKQNLAGQEGPLDRRDKDDREQHKQKD